jgi:hypothetical protein
VIGETEVLQMTYILGKYCKVQRDNKERVITYPVWKHMGTDREEIFH